MASTTTETATSEAKRRALYVDAMRLQLTGLHRATYGGPHQPRVERLIQLFDAIEGGAADPAVTYAEGAVGRAVGHEGAVEYDPDAADKVQSC